MQIQLIHNENCVWMLLKTHEDEIKMKKFFIVSILFVLLYLFSTRNLVKSKCDKKKFCVNDVKCEFFVQRGNFRVKMDVKDTKMIIKKLLQKS